MLPKEKEWAKNARPSVITANEFKAAFESELKKPVDEDPSEIGYPIDTQHVIYHQSPLLIGQMPAYQEPVQIDTTTPTKDTTK